MDNENQQPISPTTPTEAKKYLDQDAKDEKLFIFIPATLKERLRIFCEEKDLNMSQVSRRAINEYLLMHKR